MEAEDSPPADWTRLLPDLAGAVLGRLSLEDRKSWNEVCRSWRELAHISRPIPRLPVLFLSDLDCSSLTISGGMNAVRSLDLPVAAQDCVGCFKDWVLILKNSAPRAPEYALVNPFTRQRSPFTRPRSASGVAPWNRRFIAIQDTSFFATYSPCQPGDGDVPFNKVVFSDSPASSSPYTVAAATPEGLMLCQEGEWFSCTCLMLQGQKDLAFVAGRLFVVMSTNGHLYAFDLQAHSNDAPIIAGIQKIRVNLPVLLPDMRITRNIIDFHGRLLLVLRSSHRTNIWDDVVSMSIFKLDLTTVPPRYLQLHTLNGDNIFVSPTSSRMFAAKLLDEVEGDKILAVDKDMEQVVFTYRIANATRGLIRIPITEAGQVAARKNILWVFQE